MRSFGDIDPSLASALNAKASEIRDAYYELQDGIGVIASLQDAVYGSHVYYALDQVGKTLGLLRGDLYDAVIGEHVFPLDNGGGVDQEAALRSWNQLAQDAQEALQGISAYQRNWGPLPSLKKAPGAFTDVVTDPLSWPWYVQVAAGGAILYYGAQFLGVVGNARQALSRRRR